MKAPRISWMVGFTLFLAIALFFLWAEHRAHILGALPYVLLQLCLIVHTFMHRGHGGHGRGSTHEHTPRTRGDQGAS